MLGLCRAPVGGMLGTCWLYVRPMLGHLGPMLRPCWAYTGSVSHVGGHVGAKLGPCWAYVGPMSWAMLSPSLAT